MRSTFSKVVAAAFVLYGCYFIATVFVLDFWGNLLSPMCAGTATALSFFAYRRSNHRDPKSYIWLLFGMASLSWMLGDLFWVVALQTGVDPQAYLPSLLGYLGTNLFYSAGLVLFVLAQVKKWNGVQLLIDIFAAILLGAVFIWSVFFQRSWDRLLALASQDMMSTLSVTLDFILLTGIAVWCLSVRTGRMSPSMRICQAGIFLFSAVDLVYYYLDWNEQYIPNSVVDALYMAAIMTTAIGALQWTHAPRLERRMARELSNVGVKRKSWLLMLYVLLTLLVSGVVHSQVLLYDLLAEAMIILLYQVCSGYVQKSVMIEQLLQKETSMNVELERRVAEQTMELTAMANEDTMTRLSNRRHFLQRLDEELERRAPYELLALVLIDTDRFKTINDTYGHQIGDKVLIELSERMIQWNTCNATLARHGGDEFLLMFKARNRGEIERQIHALMKTCSQPIRVEDYELHTTVSAGIAICPLDADNSVSLLSFADIAMYHAKSLGFNKHVFFDPYLNEKARKKNQLELLLKKANKHKDFELYYQPQFSLPDRKLVGAEALLRWNHPDFGFIPPDSFIPVLEELGYMAEVGHMVANRAFKQAERWNSRYGIGLKIGVNISPLQLKNRDFLHNLQKSLDVSGINPACVDLEITESAMLEDDETMDKIFQEFQNMGVSVSVDDFGSGYSSLRYLKRYPFNRIKIDKSLVNGISASDNDRNIIKAIIAMSQSIGMGTIAEGVEHESQLETLCEMGCDEVQGFLLGKPVPPQVFEQQFLYEKRPEKAYARRKERV